MPDFEERFSPADDFEVEVSALDADEAAPIVQSSPGQSSSRQARIRRRLLGVSALLAALLVFASVPSLRGQALRLFGGAASPASGSGYFSYAPLTPQPTLGQGWSLAGPAYASMVAFAPSAPATAYTCGMLKPPEGWTVPISVGISRDAGRTWQTLSTPASGGSCDLTVDPTNAQDVVLLAMPLCTEGCQPPQTAKLYRTFDGGRHWNLWSLPPTGVNQLPDLLYAQWMWVGSTLFIAPYLTSDTGYVRLAASVAGQALVWLKTASLFAGAPADAAINGLLATDATLYIRVGVQTCTSLCTWFMQSRDDGASWSRFHPMFQGQPVDLMATGGDGRTLLGQVARDAPPDSHIDLRSTDDGATWQKLPPRPDLLVAEALSETPDGSVYAEFEQDPDSPTGAQGTEAALGIYQAAAGAASWSYAAPPPAGRWFTVAWDAVGHPVALWGGAYTNPLLAGMARHQP